MDTQDKGPSWWQLYLLLPLMIVLLVLGARARFSEVGHEAAAFGVLVVVCALGALWVRANARALLYGSHQEIIRSGASGKWPLAYPQPVVPPEIGARPQCEADRRSDQGVESVSASTDSGRE